MAEPEKRKRIAQKPFSDRRRRRRTDGESEPTRAKSNLR